MPFQHRLFERPGSVVGSQDASNVHQKSIGVWFLIQSCLGIAFYFDFWSMLASKMDPPTFKIKYMPVGLQKPRAVGNIQEKIYFWSALDANLPRFSFPEAPKTSKFLYITVKQYRFGHRFSNDLSSNLNPSRFPSWNHLGCQNYPISTPDASHDAFGSHSPPRLPQCLQD